MKRFYKLVCLFVTLGKSTQNIVFTSKHNNTTNYSILFFEYINFTYVKYFSYVTQIILFFINASTANGQNAGSYTLYTARGQARFHSKLYRTPKGYGVAALLPPNSSAKWLVVSLYDENSTAEPNEKDTLSLQSVGAGKWAKGELRFARVASLSYNGWAIVEAQDETAETVGAALLRLDEAVDTNAANVWGVRPYRSGALATRPALDLFVSDETPTPIPPFIIKKQKKSELRSVAKLQGEGAFTIKSKKTSSSIFWCYLQDPSPLKQEAALLYYLATTAENKRLQKKELTPDIFWNERPDGGDDLRKVYLKRASYAFAHFSAIVPGWFTDRGMIYIIFGRPDAVSLFKDKEIWHYAQTPGLSSPSSFTFVREPFFNAYRLVRRLDYQPIWFSAVSAWRNGEIILNEEE